MTLGYSCFPFLWNKKADTTRSTSPSQILAEGAKRISQDLAREMPTAEEDEFCLHLRGFEKDDPIVRAAKEERTRRQNEMAAEKQRAEEEDLLRRMRSY